MLASVFVVAIAAVAVATLAISRPSWLQPRPPRDLVITTATPGGTFIVVGERLARILSEYSGNAIGTVVAKPSAGSAENVERLADRDADIAFVSEAVLAGHPRNEDIRILATLYTDVLQIVVRKSASIERLSDLMGKRVSIGTEAGASELLSPKIWKAANLPNLDYSRVKISSFQNAVEKLQANEMDRS